MALNPVSQLNTMTQTGDGIAPEYTEILTVNSPDKPFAIQVKVSQNGTEITGTGTGANKKSAKHAAAQDAIAKITQTSFTTTNTENRVSYAQPTIPDARVAHQIAKTAVEFGDMHITSRETRRQYTLDDAMVEIAALRQDVEQLKAALLQQRSPPPQFSSSSILRAPQGTVQCTNTELHGLIIEDLRTNPRSKAKVITQRLKAMRQDVNRELHNCLLPLGFVVKQVDGIWSLAQRV